MTEMKLSSSQRFVAATITYPGDVSDANALALRKQLDENVNDYYYDRVEVEIINNGGGVFSGLHLLMSSFKQHQNRGVIIATHGLGHIASAAAVLLSNGSLKARTVAPGAQLLYHLGRVQSRGQSITASKALDIRESLIRVDDLICSELVEHILPVAESSSESGAKKQGWKWPLAEIKEPSFSSKKLKPKFFVQKKACIDHMQKTLKEIFSIDAFMQPETAIALGLIDHIKN